MDMIDRIRRWHGRQIKSEREISRITGLLRHPQTNGMVERFNGRISEVVSQTRFASAAELETTLSNYVKTYNHLIPQRALNRLSLVQALKEWQARRPKEGLKKAHPVRPS